MELLIIIVIIFIIMAVIVLVGWTSYNTFIIPRNTMEKMTKQLKIQRKKLDIAIEALEWYSENALHEHADKALEEINKINF